MTISVIQRLIGKEELKPLRSICPSISKWIWALAYLLEALGRPRLDRRESVSTVVVRAAARTLGCRIQR